MHVMMRQIMALFDEYQSKENAKHVMRALKESARQGFWNGSFPPIGYRTVAAEQRGAKTKKKLEIEPLHADTVRLIYRVGNRVILEPLDDDTMPWAAIDKLGDTPFIARGARAAFHAG